MDNENKQRIPQDNLVRKAAFLGVSDEKSALIDFMVNAFDDIVIVRMSVRLRGIVPKRKINDKTYGTFEFLEEKLKGKDVILCFCPKPQKISNMPFLVDVFLEDETHLNKWLIENGYASEYIKGDRGEKE